MGACTTHRLASSRLPGFMGVIRRRARRVARLQQRFMKLDARSSALAADCSPRAAEIIEVRSRIAAAMEDLGIRRREIARRYWLEGWRAPEIAQELGIRLSTVWTHLYRAAKHLRAALAPLQRRDAAQNATSARPPK